MANDSDMMRDIRQLESRGKKKQAKELANFKMEYIKKYGDIDNYV